jgi:hypothetical protein
MRRREFIALLAGVAAWPLMARAQQRPMPLTGQWGSRSASTAWQALESLSSVGHTGSE